MKELKCPNCGNFFTVDEADYASIVSQVRNAEFEAEMERRIADLHKQHQTEQQVIEANALNKYQQELNKKAEEQIRMEKDWQAAIAQKDAELVRLQSALNVVEQKKQSELSVAIAGKEKEISDLKSAIRDKDSALEIAVLKEQQKAQEDIKSKEAEIALLKAAAELDKQNATIQENALRDRYEARLKLKQEEVDYYKDLKARMSTKMIGETLEIHCSTQFNQMLRPMMPNAYFEKDNNASGGTKGDFIFRDFGEDGTEYVSIMFEMKNEADETATKHKNEDFLKKLDTDRRAKGCEFAVLVSLLEPDNELYNGGIVDMSYRYDKMYVIRPQFFIPMITLLVQTSKKGLEYSSLPSRRNNPSMFRISRVSSKIFGKDSVKTIALPAKSSKRLSTR